MFHSLIKRTEQGLSKRLIVKKTKYIYKRGEAMKKEKSGTLYETPKMIISEFNSADIIATSGTLGGWDNSNYIDPNGWT